MCEIVCYDGCHSKEASMPKKPIEPIKICCPQCTSSQVVTRKSDRKRWCRKCLYEGAMKDFEIRRAKAA